jgi:hypothetical protein
MIQTINFSSNPGDSSNRVKKNLTLSDYVKMLGINTVDYYCHHTKEETTKAYGQHD